MDKTNYTALVFIGKCASELGQADQSLMAYKKAIDSDETQLLAWQVINKYRTDVWRVDNAGSGGEI